MKIVVESVSLSLCGCLFFAFLSLVAIFKPVMGKISRFALL